MSSTVKSVQQRVTRYLRWIFFAIYLLINIVAIFAIYQHQNNVFKEFETKALTDQQITTLANIPIFTVVNGAHLSLAKSNSYRQLPITNSRWTLNFQQPFVLLLTSVFFIFTTVLLIGGSVMVQRIVSRVHINELMIFEQLENWANLAVIQGKVSNIQQVSSTESDHVIVSAIHHLQQQLHNSAISDISSDSTIRASVLLDQETRIGNRAFFDNRLQAFLKGEDARGAILLIQFKELDLVQSLYGYQQAMTLLSTLIQVTKQRLQHQPSYFLARHSDYELSILLPGAFIHEVEKLTDRLLNNLQTVATPVGINQEEFIHIGISCFGHDQSAYQIMSEADMALRSAQLQGPSQWFMFEVGELEEVKTKGSLKWRTFLNSAIGGNGFVIFFQPVVACDNTQVLHHEVLSKVRDQDGTLISARVFLPMAKKCGLTAKIDLLILEQVCRVLAYEKKQQDDCSINISIDSLLTNNFTDNFLSILARFPDVKGRLMIEISEYQLVNHLKALQPIIYSLRAAGVKIVADKVGQYVVSAHYLDEFQVYTMKLHRSIVLDIDKKIENQVFVQSLTTLAANKNIPIYALGVEKQSEWRTLLQLGIKGGQGHFFTEPVAQVAKAIHLD